jgi:hypothetical protein
MKNPIALVKEKFGDKAKLVAAVEKLAKDDLWLARTNEDKGLAHVSNAKLLRLHAVLSEVNDKFGSRDKLVAAILELEKRTKDDGYKARLSKYPAPRLLDLLKSTQKRANAKSGAAKKAEAKPAKAAKPAAKKASAEKPAAKPAAKKAAKKA